jgi:streptomycin 6-kinase
LKEEAMLNVDPKGCASKIIDIHGAAGVAWLDRLPAIIADCARRWSLTVMPPFEDLSYNYVAPAMRADGTHVVLKAGVPHPELIRELEALRYFGGDGIVRLLDADADQGVLLLERLVPGTSLQDLDDDEQLTQVAACVMSHLWKPAPTEHSFATVTGWANGLRKLRACFDGGYGPFPPGLVDKAEGLFTELLSMGSEAILIHGDMHAGNILKSEREPWLAIDPKGVVGNRLYDVATFVNSVPETRLESQVKHGLERRGNQIAEMLELDREQILGWTLAQAVLSGWWSFEDHGHGWEWAFTLAELEASLS